MSGLDLASLTARKKPLLAPQQNKRHDSRLGKHGHNGSVSHERNSYNNPQRSFRIDNTRSCSPGRDGYETLDEEGLKRNVCIMGNKINLT